MIARGFGHVIAEVNLETGTSSFVVSDPTAGIRRPQLHSLDEIVATHQSVVGLADPVARDFARALEWAGKMIRSMEEDNDDDD